MKKCIKNITCILLFFLMFPLYSCMDEEKYYNDLRKRFENCTPDASVVIAWQESCIYFADHDLKWWDVIEEDVSAHLFFDQKLYFIADKSTGFRNESFRIYQCDLYGNSKKILFEKSDYKSFTGATGNGDTIYVALKLDTSEKVIDAYNVRTGEYTRVASGKNVSLSEYEKSKEVYERYTRRLQDGILTLIDKEKNVQHTIDTDLTKNDLFAQALDGLTCEYQGSYIVSNRIFLLYRLPSPFVWDPLYPHLVCEYNPDTKEISFASLVITHDIDGLRVEVV